MAVLLICIIYDATSFLQALFNNLKLPMTHVGSGNKTIIFQNLAKYSKLIDLRLDFCSNNAIYKTAYTKMEWKSKNYFESCRLVFIHKKYNLRDTSLPQMYIKHHLLEYKLDKRTCTIKTNWFVLNHFLYPLYRDECRLVVLNVNKNQRKTFTIWLEANAIKSKKISCCYYLIDWKYFCILLYTKRKNY